MRGARRQALSVVGSLTAVAVLGTFIAVHGADGDKSAGLPASAAGAERGAGDDGVDTVTVTVQALPPGPSDGAPAQSNSSTTPLPATPLAAPSSATTVPRTTMSPWPSPPADPSGPVAAAVADAAEQGVRQSVLVLDRSSGSVLAERNSERAFPALSLVKLLVAVDLLDGGRPDSDTRGQIDEMIAASDDVAGSDLYSATGGDAMVVRVADRYGLTGTTPTPDGRWWGNVQTTATDMARLLRQALADPATATVIAPAMQASTAFAADGVDQRFGMRVVPGAGVKQGWGCCLSGVLAVHSMGFTDDRIVVVLSAAEPQDYSLGSQDGLALQADAGGQISIATVTATVRAALGGPASADGPGFPTFMPAG